MRELMVDDIGMPMIKVEKFWIALLPMSKWHFEELLSIIPIKGDLFTEEWYRELLKINPRVPFRELREPWRLFVTGVKPDIVKLLLEFLRCRLPTYEEWLKLYELEDTLRREREFILRKLKDLEAPEPVLLWVEHGLFPLTSEGFLEMLEDGRVVGRPFYELYPNLWFPATSRSIDLSSPHLLKALSFRYVRMR